MFFNAFKFGVNKHLHLHYAWPIRVWEATCNDIALLIVSARNFRKVGCFLYCWAPNKHMSVVLKASVPNVQILWLPSAPQPKSPWQVHKHWLFFEKGGPDCPYPDAALDFTAGVYLCLLHSAGALQHLCIRGSTCFSNLELGGSCTGSRFSGYVYEVWHAGFHEIARWFLAILSRLILKMAMFNTAITSPLQWIWMEGGSPTSGKVFKSLSVASARELS